MSGVSAIVGPGMHKEALFTHQSGEQSVMSAICRRLYQVSSFT